ncbi:Metallo-dependent phosphatase-like protein [Rhypophila decipiens]|uniref:Metallo-dependent phosphatase-like protein n=1 Tax=Rhypophila decipiens TaxID=261697 RepID=A0AAN6Y5Y2_9PEZI|nr:Metallo-dependent phosphatase-like protein [Rhypophila decipiens]
MKRLLSLLLPTLTCVTAVAGEDVLISERHDLSRRFYDEKGNYNMSFYHINDVHAHLDEFSSSGLDCNATKEDCFGGYSRVRTLINKGRKIYQDSLFLNVGDEFLGTDFFRHFKGGSKIAETLNLVGFDAMTLGNHEFDLKDDKLGEFLEVINFPVLSANIQSDHPILNKTIKPYHIFKEHKLAVIGVTTDETPSISQPGPGTIFHDPIKTIQDTVDHIRSTTMINRIAAITHIGYEEDIRLARETTGLYLIMGGHSHTLLGDFPGSEGDYPTIQRNKNGEEVFIVQAHRWGEHLGYIDVAFEPDGRIRSTHQAPIRITEEVEQEPELQAKVGSWRSEFEEENRKIIGSSSVVLDNTACKTTECVMGNMVTDAIFESRVKDNKPGDAIPAFAFMNGGGLRATIDPGNFTWGDLGRVSPFNNAVVEFDITGQQLWDVFAGILQRVPQNATLHENDLENNKTLKVSSFVQVSSQIRIRWKPSRDGQSIPPPPPAPIGTLTSFTISGKPVELYKTYKVLSIDFIANGGDNFFVPRLPRTTYVEQLDDALMYYIQKHNPINARIEGRLSPELSPEGKNSQFESRSSSSDKSVVTAVVVTAVVVALLLA